jgi:hypothetical protein
MRFAFEVLEHSPIPAFWVLILAYGFLPVLGIVLGLLALMGIGAFAESSTSRIAKRVAIVVILLVIGLAVASIAHTVVNDPG